MARNNMTEESLMKRSKVFILLFGVLCASLSVMGQDALPMAIQNEKPMGETKTLRSWHLLTDPILLDKQEVPSFIVDSINVIEDREAVLKPFFEKLRDLKEGVSKEHFRVVHIGDSHIRGNMFPNQVRDRLQSVFGEYLEYESLGINGATCLTFTNPRWIKQIKMMNPDLLILSFGTNESHNRRYQSVVHFQQMDELVQLLIKENNSLPILFTTPPGSYTSRRGRNRRRVYTKNQTTIHVTNSIKNYAHKRGYPIWDLFSVVGGENKACDNWVSAKLMRPDHVHFLPEGYELQGDLLFQAFIKQFNEYAIR